jgi:nitroreductase
MPVPRATRDPEGMATAAHPSAPSSEDLLARAVLAPSSHNTQPWRFTVHGGRIRLHADRSRALPVNDPQDRELTISCGAALLNLRIAATFAGADARVELLPDAGDPDLLAEVDVVPGETRSPEADRLFRAIPDRHTHRAPFARRPVAVALAEALEHAAGTEGAQLARLDPDERQALAELVAEGDREQFDDPRWRRELAVWLHPRRSGDGLVQGAPLIARWVIRHVDLGRRTGDSDAALVLGAPLVAVLDTPGDDVASWLVVGQALQRVLLTAAAEGVQAGFLNQPVQVAHLRPQLARAIGRASRHPQVVLRLGHPAGEVSRAPRRPLGDVVGP